MENPSKDAIHGNIRSGEGNDLKVKQPRRLLCELVLEFTSKSTLHGLRYFTERGLHAVEKLFWMVIFMASVCLCVWAMSKVWVKWNSSPIIITVNEQLMSASEVPFPAVTICPGAKVNQLYFNYTKHWITYKQFFKQFDENDENNNTKENVEKRKKEFIDQTPFMKDLANVNIVCQLSDDDLMPYVDQTRAQYIIQAAPSYDDIFFSGHWRNKRFARSIDSFVPVLTSEGVCFTFNGLATEETFRMDRMQRNFLYINASIPRRSWSPDAGYLRPDADAYPRRAQKSGPYPDLSVTLQGVLNPDLICSGFYKGFKLYIHHPADLPQASSYYFSLQDHETASFAVKVNVVTTSDSLVKYPPIVRQCYFSSERSLKYFGVYTLSNCRLECQANVTLAQCGCVSLHMPRNNDTELCLSDEQRRCAWQVESQPMTDDGHGNQSDNMCQCLPSCLTVQYEAEVLKENYDFVPFVQARQQAFNEINNSTEPFRKRRERKTNLTWVRMYFKEDQFISLRRSELYGTTEFLANCGGLLGLFLGFSFLSLIELVYFFTLRLACIFRRSSNTEKTGKEALSKLQ